MKSVLQVYFCDCAAKVLWGLASLLLIRFMPHEQFALLTLAIAFSTLLVTGIAANLNTVYIVGFEKLRLEHSPFAILALELCLLAVLAILLLPLGLRMGPLYYSLAILLTFANFLFHFAKAFFQRALMFSSFSIAELTRTSLALMALLMLVYWVYPEIRAWQVILIQAMVILTVVAVMLGRQIAATSFRHAHSVRTLAGRIAQARYLYMIGYYLVLALLLRMDILMLRMLADPLELASYGAAFRYQSLILVFLNSVHTVFLPLTQQAAEREELKSVFVKHSKMIWGLVPIVLFGAILSHWVIPLIDGGRYPSSVDAFCVLAVSALVSLVFSPHVNVLLRYAHFEFLFVLVIGATLFSAVANAILIPRYDALGAAVATLLSVGLVNVLIYVRSRALLQSRPLPQHARGILVSES